MKATLRGRAPLVLLLAVGVAAVNACAAAGTDAADEAPGVGAGGGATGGASGSGSGATSGASGNGGSGATGGGSAGDGGSAGSGASSGSGGDAGSGQGGASGSAGSGSAGKSGGPGACGNACGPVELCDPDHLGFDDNCDGQVDEGCPCTDGQSHWCFKGDPSYRGSSGCFDGTERCSGGVWGACQGGKHGLAGEDSCLGAAGSCIDLQASPFAKVKLGDGTKGFAGDADPGSHKYQVTCPSGVQSCGASGFAGLQRTVPGEHTPHESAPPTQRAPPVQRSEATSVPSVSQRNARCDPSQYQRPGTHMRGPVSATPSIATTSRGVDASGLKTKRVGSVEHAASERRSPRRSEVDVMGAARIQPRRASAEGQRKPLQSALRALRSAVSASAVGVNASGACLGRVARASDASPTRG